MRSDGLETRARVLSAAAAVFARDGFEGASLRGIALAAGIDIATLKYHVGDKVNLFAEVYRDGYNHFQQSLGPLLLRIPLSRNAAELRVELANFVEKGYDYLHDNEVFMRLWLFRLLESTKVFDEEETVRLNVVSMLEAAVAILRERGLVRDVDVRLLVLLLTAALPTLVLSTSASPSLLGTSGVAPRERFVAFFADLVDRYVVSDAV